MLCPTCKNVNLAMTDRQGIEIDYCPDCRGIWLDRGELDRLIERAEKAAIPAAPPPAPRYEQPRHEHRHHDDSRHHHHKHKRPKSLLGELFDF